MSPSKITFAAFAYASRVVTLGTNSRQILSRLAGSGPLLLFKLQLTERLGGLLEAPSKFSNHV
jgi:hypothetical protein